MKWYLVPGEMNEEQRREKARFVAHVGGYTLELIPDHMPGSGLAKWRLSAESATTFLAGMTRDLGEMTEKRAKNAAKRELKQHLSVLEHAVVNAQFALEGRSFD